MARTGNRGGSTLDESTLFLFLRKATNMKSSTENEVAGRVHELKGKIKEKLGRLTNNPRLEGEGIGERLAGKVQKKIGQVQKAVEKP